MADLTERILSRGLEAGLDRIGVCSSDPFPGVRADLASRKAAGLSSTLGFTYARPNVASVPRATFPWASTLVVAGVAYMPAAGDPGPSMPGTGRIARFAESDFYQPLRHGLEQVAAALESDGYRGEVMADDGRLVDRAVAHRAGIGWWGKNTMILAPDVGPWMLLGSVLTDAPLTLSVPMKRDCGSCEACLPACPTGALVAPGVLDARRCLAAIVQLPGDIPIEFRAAMGDRVYGCDECLDVCPPGKRRLTGERGGAGRVDLVDILTSSPDELAARFERFYIPGRDGRYLQRNAIVALGNSGDERHVTVLGGFLESDPMLARHAAWALGRIGGDAAREALRTATPSAHTEAEISLALAALDPSGK